MCIDSRIFFGRLEVVFGFSTCFLEGDVSFDRWVVFEYTESFAVFPKSRSTNCGPPWYTERRLFCCERVVGLFVTASCTNARAKDSMWLVSGPESDVEQIWSNLVVDSASNLSQSTL